MKKACVSSQFAPGVSPWLPEKQSSMKSVPRCYALSSTSKHLQSTKTRANATWRKPPQRMDSFSQ